MGWPSRLGLENTLIFRGWRWIDHLQRDRISSPWWWKVEGGKVYSIPALDPTKNDTYEFIDGILSETKNQFLASKNIHLGLDEVRFQCWDSNPEIKKFMEYNGIKNYSDLQNYYLANIINPFRQ